MNCIKCGRETGDFHFRVLQVQTLHVRDLNKEKRVQALGDFEEYDVCRACAEEKLQTILDTKASLRKFWLICGAMMAAGLALTGIFWSGAGALRLFGLGMAVCGILCLIGQMKTIRAKEMELRALPEDEALYQCAWQCLVDGAPKKHDINDISYIPVDEKTLSRKNGDLMILYDLLPEIAVQAHKRIHGMEES